MRKIIIAMLLLSLLIVGCDTNIGEATPIKELDQNTDYYVGKEIVVFGKMSSEREHLIDSERIGAKLGSSCKQLAVVYEVGKLFMARGTFKEHCTILGCSYWIDCSEYIRPARAVQKGELEAIESCKAKKSCEGSGAPEIIRTSDGEYYTCGCEGGRVKAFHMEGVAEERRELGLD